MQISRDAAFEALDFVDCAGCGRMFDHAEEAPGWTMTGPVICEICLLKDNLAAERSAHRALVSAAEDACKEMEDDPAVFGRTPGGRRVARVLGENLRAALAASKEALGDENAG